MKLYEYCPYKTFASGDKIVIGSKECHKCWFFTRYNPDKKIIECELEKK